MYGKNVCRQCQATATKQDIGTSWRFFKISKDHMGVTLWGRAPGG